MNGEPPFTRAGGAADGVDGDAHDLTWGSQRGGIQLHASRIVVFVNRLVDDDAGVVGRNRDRWQFLSAGGLDAEPRRPVDERGAVLDDPVIPEEFPGPIQMAAVCDILEGAKAINSRAASIDTTIGALADALGPRR